MSTTSSSPSDDPSENTVYLTMKAASGDDGAFTALYERVSAGVRCAARLRLAAIGRNAEDVVDDVMNEAFAQTFARIRTGEFDPERSDGSLRNYLAKVIRNRAIDCIRSDNAQVRDCRRECLQGEDDAPELALHLPSDDNTPSLYAIRDETWGKLQEAMLHLTERDQRALDLVVFCGMSFVELAEELSLSNSDAARLVVSRARRRLKKRLEGLP